MVTLNVVISDTIPTKIHTEVEVAHTMSVRRMWPRVVLVGDSITQQGGRVGGWVARIAGALERKCDVVNRGFSGYTTRTIRVGISTRLLIHFGDDKNTCQL